MLLNGNPEMGYFVIVIKSRILRPHCYGYNRDRINYSFRQPAFFIF